MALTQTEKASILANLSFILVDTKGITKIANHVVNNEITIAELQNTGNFTPNDYQNVNNEINRLKAEKAENDQWQQAVAQNTIHAYQNYLTAYPAGKYTAQANTMIAGLQQQQRQSQKQQYLEALRRDINAYNTTELNMYGITYDDIVGAGIGLPDGIRGIWDDPGITFQLGTTPEALPSGRTEIYFWGTPGSGKTCTLAAILSTARAKGFFDPTICNGSLYMSQLSNLFDKGEVTTLPPSTAIDITQGLSFDLGDANAQAHPVTLIEISGEIFQCFTHVVNGQQIPDDGHLAAYNSLLGFLRSDNPKYHFFVIDVNNIGKDALGLTQMNYLHYAATFFSTNQIFNKSTAGINILVTKSDLLGETPKERQMAAVRMLEKRYLSFVNSLKKIASTYNLIGRNDPLSVIPFTLGNVYLQNKCLFDSQTSDAVIRILQQNVAKTSVKRKSRWLNW